jgi:purine-binding chemotaxis protein CheW
MSGDVKASGTEGVDVSGKYLTFVLGNEEYGIAILKVQEIIGMMSVTVVPRTPHFIRGVINLRGKIIPVVDLRTKFGMPQAEQTPETCIIVVRTRELEIGVVVDKVCEVLDVNAADVDDAPNLGLEVNTDYLLGICKADGRPRLLLDIEKALASEDIEALRSGLGH